MPAILDYLQAQNPPQSNPLRYHSHSQSASSITSFASTTDPLNPVESWASGSLGMSRLSSPFQIDVRDAEPTRESRASPKQLVIPAEERRSPLSNAEEENVDDVSLEEYFCIYCTSSENIVACMTCYDALCPGCALQCHLCKESSCRACARTVEVLRCSRCTSLTCAACAVFHSWTQCDWCEDQLCKSCVDASEGGVTTCTCCKRCSCSDCQDMLAFLICTQCERDVCEECMESELHCRECHVRNSAATNLVDPDATPQHYMYDSD